MNNLLKRLEENTLKRKKIKNRIDSEIALSSDLSHADAVQTMSVSATGTESNRLLDEGAVIEGDGSVYAYIKKGTLEKFLNRQNVYLDNLPEDYVGNINIGHLDHATFPFPVGEWAIDNMSLVDIGSGRHGIDVDITVDEQSIFIQELKRLGYDLSISAEFMTHTDWEASEDLGFWVIDEILIFAYAIVGDGKNVNSNGMKLKGDTDMSKEKIENLAVDTVEEEPVDETVDLACEETDEEAKTPVEAEAKTEEEEETVDASAQEDTAEEEEPEEEEASKEEEAEGEEDGDEDEADEEADGEDEAFKQVESHIKDLESEVEKLTAENAELKKTNRRLQKKLKNEYDKKDAFVSKFVGIVDATDENKSETKEKATDYFYGDGIGE